MTSSSYVQPKLYGPNPLEVESNELCIKLWRNSNSNLSHGHDVMEDIWIRSFTSEAKRS